MRKVIITISLVAAFLTGIPSTETYVAEAAQKPMSVEELVSHYADIYGVDQELAHYIALHESEYDPTVTGDMHLTCPARTSPFYGQPVRARGVFQLTQCWYYHVSDEEAFDAETNIKIAMEVIARGRETCITQFTTCRHYYRMVQ